MDLSGQAELDAPRAAAWAALTDLRAIAACSPDTAGVQWLDDRHGHVETRVGGGLISATLSLDVELTELAEPDHATVTVSGGAAGTKLAGQARFTLSGEPAGPTGVAWTAQFDVSGPFAGMAQQAISAEGQRVVDGIFDCVRTNLARRPA